MQFDIFHSLSRIDSILPRLSDAEVFKQFFSQVTWGEKLGYDTIWIAESHFSSELQKQNAHPVIPNFRGEVGLNCDSFLLWSRLAAMTTKINFGTAIHNIVGGNGGPVCSADRVRSFAVLNQVLPNPRTLNVGIAAGRFPYINNPFGIVPRCPTEVRAWGEYRRYIFLEALEIFLRLSSGETLASDQLRTYQLNSEKTAYTPRWNFEPLTLVPALTSEAASHLNFVLGSHDPMARDLALSLCDIDIFNLSFTPPEQLAAVHQEMETKCREYGRRPWNRSRLPRTVLIFIDANEEKARSRASSCFDTYCEAMRGTVECPDKDLLMTRALIGSPGDIIEQLSPDNPKKFHPDDRVMLWFEFNQSENQVILDQMQLFAEEVLPHFAKSSSQERRAS